MLPLVALLAAIFAGLASACVPPAVPCPPPFVPFPNPPPAGSCNYICGKPAFPACAIPNVCPWRSTDTVPCDSNALISCPAQVCNGAGRFRRCMPAMVNKCQYYWKAPSADAVSLSNFAVQPLSCDINNGQICPTIACSTSISTAISGNGGCATAASYISATALSFSDYHLDTAIETQISSQATSLCNAPAPYVLATAGTTVAKAFAQAVAYAMSDYWLYVCSCCKDGSFAQTSVDADVLAVARAVAEAASQALAAVKGCDGKTVLSLGISYATALANATELAILTVNKQQLTANPGQCSTQPLVDLYTDAIASATACTFASAMADAFDVLGKNADAATCSASLALSGSDSTGLNDCLVIDTKNCGCTPDKGGWNNGGFQKKVMGGTGVLPSWTATSGATIVSNAAISISATTSATLFSSDNDGSFAQIPAPCSSTSNPASVSTKVSIPSCATTISVDYVFDCSSASDGTGQGHVELSLRDSSNIPVPGASTSFDHTCPYEGYTYDTITKKVKWLTLTLTAPYPGEFTVVVNAVATGATGSTCRTGKTPFLYVDNLTFHP